MDVRAKQLLSYLRCPLNLSGLGGDFAPRHLNRSTSNEAKTTLFNSVKVIINFIHNVRLLDS
jgi:hypothetical protein